MFLNVNPYLGLTAVNSVFFSFKLVWHTLKGFAHVDEVFVAILPVVEVGEALDQIGLYVSNAFFCGLIVHKEMECSFSKWLFYQKVEMDVSYWFCWLVFDLRKINKIDLKIDGKCFIVSSDIKNKNNKKEMKVFKEKNMEQMSRRNLLKKTLWGSASLVGLSAMTPLYVHASMEFKGPKVPDVDAVKVSDHCYYIPALGSSPSPENYGMFSNPGFVVTPKGVVVIDTGSSVQIGEMILRQIKKVTDKPVVMVINTHYHGDHWLGNHAFVAANQDVKLYSHEAVQKVLKTDGGKFWFDFMQRNTDNKITGTVVTIPNQTLKGGEVFGMGGVTLKVHHFGRMHTESDVAVEVVEDKTIYMGDMVMRRIANMEDGSYKGTIAGLDSVLSLPVNQYIPGHGKHEGKQLILDGKEFMETIYKNTAKYYDEGLSDFEMKPKIMVEPFMKNVASQWSGYQSTLGKFIVVAIKEYEQSMF